MHSAYKLEIISACSYVHIKHLNDWLKWLVTHTNDLRLFNTIGSRVLQNYTSQLTIKRFLISDFKDFK